MRAALQFLTILPVRAPVSPPGRAAVWFPLTGVLLGLAAAAAMKAPLGPVFAVFTLVVLTGGLHEDGLADVADAVRAHRGRERMFAILDDSRIGAHGALALIFSVLIRWQALEHLQGNPWLRLPIACGLSRAAIVLLASASKPAGDGLGAAFIRTLPRSWAWIVALQVMMIAAAAGWRAAGILIVTNVAVIAALRLWFHARLGGVTGDCLGSACQCSEALSLAVLACA